MTDPMADLERQLKPYRDQFPSFRELPAEGLPRSEVTGLVERLASAEEGRWREGYASGAVYHGDPEHVAFLSRVYAAQSQSNPLHPDLWPSAAKFEAEIVAMTAAMLGAGQAAPRDAGRRHGELGRDREHPAGDEGLPGLRPRAPRHRRAGDRRAGHRARGVRQGRHGSSTCRWCGSRSTMTSRPTSTRWPPRVTERTAVVVGSAPTFPHGVIDPIPEIAALAADRGVGCHVDACLGGFILPWAQRLGYPVPPFDFRLPGVTSMSADTHKYGYAAKGSSVVLYRGTELRQFQYYTVTDWPGGLYLSPTFAGSRPGALSATCWAAMVSIGEDGYTEAARRILETGARIRDGVAAIPGLRVLGDPLWVTAFAADDGLDVYQVMENMSRRGWSLNGLQRPAAVHIAVTLRHTLPGVADRFLADLADSVAEVRSNPGVSTGMAPVYGMAATLPAEVVRQVLTGYLDLLFEV